MRSIAQLTTDSGLAFSSEEPTAAHGPSCAAITASAQPSSA